MKILAVEDEPEYLEMLEEVMRSIGHSVTIAPNGAEALEILDRQKVDVIVADVRMPVMDGLEFHRRVREKPDYLNTPFVFLTGVTDLGPVRAACTADCDLVLKKPFPLDSLIRIFAGQFK